MVRRVFLSIEKMILHKTHTRILYGNCSDRVSEQKRICDRQELATRGQAPDGFLGAAWTHPPEEISL
jgi:hypothetical protein